jgi:hypothetical protein
VLEASTVDDFARVAPSARRLFDRLNTSMGSPNVYDFEVAQDTGLPLGVVRRCLEPALRAEVTLEVYGSDYRVTALTSA